MSVNMRYLAVDDDPSFHFVLTQMMCQLGYQAPVCVTSAREALERLANPNDQFDAILLDIQMPEMDGIEACQHIRAIAHHSSTPIMMVTTMVGRDHVDQAFAVGATDYLTKPINRIELQARLGMLDRLVQEHNLARSLQFAMESMDDVPGMRFAFEDAVALPKNGSLIEYLALENHLLTLSRLKLHTHTAIAFQVVGGANLFRRLTRIEFLDCMADVGAAIAACMKRQSFLLAYAGSGEFVCILNRAQPVDTFEIEHELGAELMVYDAVYESLGLPMLEVRVGATVSSGLFSPSAVKTMLGRARASVRGQSGYQMQFLAG
ncbi:PleD family two-component system response regulator [Pseudotabrizicola sp.]|uniref:response regulator n=1 Tax=Pseudotabrizicola sp. TaxID=2939647 RepID=UPI002724E94F|nr:response regulator [Pseudotabrizicola sp.]MDO8884134.1 response regulator [Pseudotabrizicola sp.]